MQRLMIFRTFLWLRWIQFTWAFIIQLSKSSGNMEFLGSFI